MRFLIAATVACLLVACGTPPSSQGSPSSDYQAQVQAYSKAGG